MPPSFLILEMVLLYQHKPKKMTTLCGVGSQKDNHQEARKVILFAQTSVLSLIPLFVLKRNGFFFFFF